MTEVTARPDDPTIASEPAAAERERKRKDDPAETSVPVRTVLRPAWIGPPKPSTYGHRPEITDHPTFLRLNLPAPKARTAQVVITGRYTDPVQIGGAGAPGRWELFFSGGTLYEVDCGLHHTTFEIDLPSALDTFPFHGEVAVEWQVTRPAWVVQQGISDVREALRPLVRRKLCAVTQRFEADAVSAAEDEIAGTDVRDIGARYGLTVELTIRLTADERAAEQAASRRKAEQDTVVDVLERRKMTNRIEHYRSIIDGGDVEQIALSLAEEPSGTEKIVSMIRDMREQDRRQVTDFLTRLIESGAVDRWEVENHIQSALNWLNVSTAHTVQTGDAHIPRDRRHGRPMRHGSASNGSAANGSSANGSGTNGSETNGSEDSGSTEGVDPASIIVMNGDGTASMNGSV